MQKSNNYSVNKKTSLCAGFFIFIFYAGAHLAAEL
jgi:hypothetical protein